MDIYTGFALTGLAITLAILVVSVFRTRKGTQTTAKFFDAIGTFIDKYYLVFLFLIFAAYIVSRVYKLDSLPHGFHVDELSMAVDAKSIHNTGKDRWGVSYPAYLMNYGGGQNVLYIYIQAFLMNFLPDTIFAFRIQAVIWGAACLFAIFGICYELTGSKGYSLIGPILVTVLPVYIMSERWGLEAYIFLPFSAIVMYSVIRAVKYERPLEWFIAGTLMGASLYTYAVSYVVWPVFLLLGGIYLIVIGKLKIKNVVIFAIPLAILATPLILFQLVNFGFLKPFKLGITEYVPLTEDRSNDLGFSHIISNLRFFKELFLGGEPLTYNSLREFGTIYMFLLPFVLIGLIMCIKDLIVSIREKRFEPGAFFFFFWLGGTFFMLLLNGPNVNRVNELFMPFLLFIFMAVYRLLRNDAWALSWMAVWTCASFCFFMYFYLFLQDQVYGYHELHTSASAGKAIMKSEAQYLKDENTHIYVLFEDHAFAKYQQVFYFAGGDDDVYSDDEATYGNVSGKLPAELDMNENAVYIITDTLPHITSYLISEGFEADQTIPEYSILYRMN